MIAPKVTRCKGTKTEGTRCEKNVYYLPQIVSGTDIAKFLFNSSGQPEAATIGNDMAPESSELESNKFDEVVEIYLTCELNHTHKYWLARNINKESSNL